MRIIGNVLFKSFEYMRKFNVKKDLIKLVIRI